MYPKCTHGCTCHTSLWTQNPSNLTLDCSGVPWGFLPRPKTSRVGGIDIECDKRPPTIWNLAGIAEWLVRYTAILHWQARKKTKVVSPTSIQGGWLHREQGGLLNWKEQTERKNNRERREVFRIECNKKNKILLFALILEYDEEQRAFPPYSQEPIRERIPPERKDTRQAKPKPGTEWGWEDMATKGGSALLDRSDLHPG